MSSAVVGCRWSFFLCQVVVGGPFFLCQVVVGGPLFLCQVVVGGPLFLCRVVVVGGPLFLCRVAVLSFFVLCQVVVFGGPIFLCQSLVVVSIPFSLFLLRFLVVSCPFFLFLPSVVVGGKYSLSFFLSSLVFYQLVVVVVVSISFSLLWLFLLPFLCLRSSRWCWSAILSLLSCSKCWWSLEFPTFLYFVPVGGE